MCLWHRVLCTDLMKKIRNLHDEVKCMSVKCHKTVSTTNFRPGVKRGIISPSAKTLVSVTEVSSTTPPCSARKTPKKQLFLSITGSTMSIKVESLDKINVSHTTDHQYTKEVNKSSKQSLTPALTPSPAEHIYRYSKQSVTPSLTPSPDEHLSSHTKAMAVRATTVVADIASKQQAPPSQSVHMVTAQKQQMLDSVRSGNTQTIAQHIVRDEQLSAALATVQQGEQDSNVKPLQRQKHGHLSVLPRKPGPCLNIKTVLFRYGDFHVKDKMAVRTSYL